MLKNPEWKRKWNETKRNEIETARVRQLISEHFDFALSHLKKASARTVVNLTI